MHKQKSKKLKEIWMIQQKDQPPPQTKPTLLTSLDFVRCCCFLHDLREHNKLKTSVLEGWGVFFLTQVRDDVGQHSNQHGDREALTSYTHLLTA